MADTVNTEELQRLLAESIGRETGLAPEVCTEIAFHLTDWKAELDELVALFDKPAELDPQQRHRIVQRFLLHATGHCMQASQLLLGYPPENPFGDEESPEPGE